MLFWKTFVLKDTSLACFVSILIVLDVILKACQCIYTHRQYSSFNPCFVGCYSESTSWSTCSLHWTLFQSLFCWMLFWKCGWWAIPLLFDTGFNPCFVGCYSESTCWVIQYLFQFLFQSLFCWMLFWKFALMLSRAAIKMFQSLFCWMLFWKCWYIVLPDHFKIVSILVLLDVILKACQIKAFRNTCIVSILVLLDVILKESHGAWIRHSIIRFNPCFVGCYSERMILLLTIDEEKRFQSLFCWMLFWKFQAIGRNQKDRGCFNPCFVECYSERPISDNRSIRFQCVSILVLLDVILKVLPHHLLLVLLLGFNPCFVGCYSESKTFSFFRVLTVGFNPCFVGCYSERRCGVNAIYRNDRVSILVLLDVILKVCVTVII